jgi:hypothetical protein
VGHDGHNGAVSPSSAYEVLVDLLDELYSAVTELVSELDDAAFLSPTRARAWCVQDLLFHLMLDAQRALMAFASPTTTTPDVDAVTYWRGFRPDAEGAEASAEHALFVRVASSAYRRPQDLVRHWRSTSAAALRAAVAADGAASVETQGHVIEVADFVHSLVVEATVHLLDLGLEVPAAPPPSSALQVVRGVLDDLLGEPVAADWDDTEYALKGTGRVPLSPSDRSVLQQQARRFPLLG